MPVDSGLDLSSQQKAAIVLASMDREKAAKVLRALPPQAMEVLAREMSRLGEVTQEMRRAAFGELTDKMKKGVNPKGGIDVAQALLQQVIGEEETAVVMKKVAGKKPPFAAIAKVDGEDLANILSKEQPSLAAIILAFMPPQKAAEILSFFDDDFREEIITRLVKRRSADPSIVARIEQIFVRKVNSVIHKAEAGDGDGGLGGSTFVAEMLQHLDRSMEEELMGSIREVDEKLADEVRDLMFTFEDISNLTDSDIQKILRQVPMDKLVIALRGVRQDVFDKISDNLSKRAKENLLEEMELMGKVKKRDIQSEQRNVVAIIRSLEAAGEITIGSGGGVDEYV